jgi:hypothetical protein
MTIVLSRRDCRVSSRSFQYYYTLINDIKGIKTHWNHMEEAKGQGYITESRAKNLIAIWT